jgi:hypothetical protein
MQKIMNKILITTTIPLVFIALSGVANATECNASEVKVLSDNCHKRVIDISNPKNPINIDEFKIGNNYAPDITISNDETKAFVANRHNGLQIIDLELFNPISDKAPAQ